MSWQWVGTLQLFATWPLASYSLKPSYSTLLPGRPCYRLSRGPWPTEWQLPAFARLLPKNAWNPPCSCPFMPPGDRCWLHRTILQAFAWAAAPFSWRMVLEQEVRKRGWNPRAPTTSYNQSAENFGWLSILSKSMNFCQNCLTIHS